METSTWKHFIHCICLFSLITILLVQGTSPASFSDIDPIAKYGWPWTIVIYLLRISMVLSVPQALFNLIGLTIYNAFEDEVELKVNVLTAPFICVRIVTRGDYPALVAESVDKNLKVCQKLGLANYIIEVVTDNELNLVSHPRLRQIVVPSKYSTSTGAMYKARALQYCLEDDVNTLANDDWIVHLDEETLLTTNSLKGILNFVSKNKHEFGQGVILYTMEPIVNHITTIIDSYRVADDMGKIRFQFSMFYRPIFSWKGSYVVAKYSAEKDVSFDHGPEGSIAEDCYFSMVAWSKSYTFEFIDGEMLEKSTFTICDYMHQRKRWLQGILLVVHSPKIPIVYRFFLALSLYSRILIPVATINVIISSFWPVPFDFLISLGMFVLAVNIYMFIYGVIKSFEITKIGIFRYTLYLLGSIFFSIPFVMLTENIIIIWGLASHKYKFHVVQKQLDDSNNEESMDDNSSGSSHTKLTNNGTNRLIDYSSQNSTNLV